MGDKHHRHALSLEVIYHLEELARLFAGQSSGGLVKDEHPGIHRQSSRDLHELLVGSTQRTDEAVRGDV